MHADKVFYMGYDLYAKDNPHFHDADLYPFDEVDGGNQLRTPQVNNFTLKVSECSYFHVLKCILNSSYILTGDSIAPAHARV